MQVMIEDSLLNCELEHLSTLRDARDMANEFTNKYGGDFYTVIIWCEGNFPCAMDYASIIVDELIEKCITISRVEIR